MLLQKVREGMFKNRILFVMTVEIGETDNSF